MEESIVNKVAQSGIITLDLSEWLKEETFSSIDLKDQLWQGLALKEKDFRAWVKEHSWEQYTNHHVNLFCSADAIVPIWAYMLVASKLQKHAATVTMGDNKAQRLATIEHLLRTKATDFEDARVVVKGCNDGDVPTEAYPLAVNILQPFVKSIMFGEPCSTVPVYKKPRIPKS